MAIETEQDFRRRCAGLVASLLSWEPEAEPDTYHQFLTMKCEARDLLEFQQYHGYDGPTMFLMALSRVTFAGTAGALVAHVLPHYLRWRYPGEFDPKPLPVPPTADPTEWLSQFSDRTLLHIATEAGIPDVASIAAKRVLLMRGWVKQKINAEDSCWVSPYDPKEKDYGVLIV